MAVGATRGKKRLARYLKPMLDESGLKAEDIARQVRCSKQTIFRMMSGDALPRWPVVLAVLGLVGAKEEQRIEALRLWEIADVPTATIQHAKVLPPKYRRFRVDEVEASLERSWDTLLIPGLLQTAAYAEAVARAGWRRTGGDAWTETAAAERRDRQSLLYREERRLRLHALIDESALRRVIGGRDVMADQLERLLVEIDRGVSLQVVPFEAGAYASIAGSMTLLAYDDAPAPELAYFESVNGIEPVDDDDALRLLYEMWTDVASVALDSARSVALITQVKDER